MCVFFFFFFFYKYYEVYCWDWQCQMWLWQCDCCGSVIAAAAVVVVAELLLRQLGCGSVAVAGWMRQCGCHSHFFKKGASTDRHFLIRPGGIQSGRRKAVVVASVNLKRAANFASDIPGKLNNNGNLLILKINGYGF
jgi:hypothetical protein